MGEAEAAPAATDSRRLADVIADDTGFSGFIFRSEAARRLNNPVMNDRAVHLVAHDTAIRPEAMTVTEVDVPESEFAFLISDSGAPE